MKEMRSEMEAHLKHDLLPFWMKLRDDRGGYFGRVTHDSTPDGGPTRASSSTAAFCGSFPIVP